MNIDLAKIIAAGEMDVWYQPQVAAGSLRVAGFEALARWNHPDRGQLAPDAFIRPSDTVAGLAAFVLARACADAAGWPGMIVSVNVSPHQFADENFPVEIAAIAAQAALPLDRLELEILENVSFHDPDRARAVMGVIREMGVRIAIDDFGQGYSRESLRLDMPVSKIKLARAIVMQENCGEWLGDFVANAHALGMEVTAEGVETPEQARAMQEAGCDYLQGYFFARPAPAAAITRALREFDDADQTDAN